MGSERVIILLFSHIGSAISIPDNSCEPPLPDMLNEEPLMDPETTAGSLPSVVATFNPIFFKGSSVEKSSLFLRLPSPVMVTSSTPLLFPGRCPAVGSISRQSRPDSPTLSSTFLMFFEKISSFASLFDISSMPGLVISSRNFGSLHFSDLTFTPSDLTSSIAASVSAHGVYA